MRSLFVWCITLFALIIAWVLIVKPIVAWRRARAREIAWWVQRARMAAFFGAPLPPPPPGVPLARLRKESAKIFARMSRVCGPDREIVVEAPIDALDGKPAEIRRVWINGREVRAHAWPLVLLAVGEFNDGDAIGLISPNDWMIVGLAFAIFLAALFIVSIVTNKAKRSGSKELAKEPKHDDRELFNGPGRGHFRIIVQSHDLELVRVRAVRSDSEDALGDLFRDCSAALADHEAPEPGEPFAVELREHGRVVDRVVIHDRREHPCEWVEKTAHGNVACMRPVIDVVGSGVFCARHKEAARARVTETDPARPTNVEFRP